MSVVGLLLAFSAARADDIRLTIEPDNNPDPKQVKVWEDYFQWNVDPNPPPEWVAPWDSDNVKRDLEVRVYWPDNTKFIGLEILVIHTEHPIEVPVQRPNIASKDLDVLSGECANSAAAAFSDVVADYYKCRAAFRKIP